MLARRFLAGCAVLGCLALMCEAELAHHPDAFLNGEAAIGRLQHGYRAPLLLPFTGGSQPAASEGQLVRPHRLTPQERHEALKEILTAAAVRQGLDPGLVMAVAWWESGWDMTMVSATGATGLMQVDPATAHDLGPKLLGRMPDIHDPYDNADLGAAVLKADLGDAGGNLAVALASYYEGSGNVDPSNLDAGAQAYVDGVTALQKRFDAGQDPTVPPSPTPSP